MMSVTNKEPAVIALGMFDGVHVGHQTLLKQTACLAEKLGAKPVAYTFLNHPQSVFGNPPLILTTPEEKWDLISRMDVDPIMVPFTKELSYQEPVAFLRVLEERFCVKGLVAGFNYHFGKGAKGDKDTLLAFGKREQIAIEIVPPVMVGELPVSSTRVRKLIQQGDIKSANLMLGRSYSFGGRVVAHRQIGTRIGFPTANILPGNKLVPPYGVYAAMAELDGKKIPSVVNIGIRPTVCEGGAVIIESHLLEPCGNIYGKYLTVHLMERVRGEKRFSSFDELKAQIAIDCQNAKQILG